MVIDGQVTDSYIALCDIGRTFKPHLGDLFDYIDGNRPPHYPVPCTLQNADAALAWDIVWESIPEMCSPNCPSCWSSMNNWLLMTLFVD